MSSSPGVDDAGGSNEDVQADEAAKNQHARLDDSGDSSEESAYLDKKELAIIGQDESAADEALSNGRPGMSMQDELGDESLSEADDASQLDDEQLDYPVDAEQSPTRPTSPIPHSPVASPPDSGSIPDDTPSVQGSPQNSPLATPLASPNRAASPYGVRRIIPSRSASGALQPFERRFSGRISLSPSESPKGASPGFLSPHSRQLSISSQLSTASSFEHGSDSDTPQAPWDVIRWTKLKKITGQAFSEIGKRNFGRPTCLAVSALIAIGTSKGLVLGFDYHQTLKIIIGTGTKAAESGAVTAVAIAADYSTIATGHANGSIFTWEINRPSRPFLHIPPLDKSTLQQPRHPDGHVADAGILHVGFLGTRHTALVSADMGGMAFSHIASRGLGAVSRSINTRRLLGRYPSPDPETERNRKPSSVLAFSPLPLGNVEQATDSLGLTAMLTPYLLVIVSTTPVAQTQFKSARPKELQPHSTLSGCLAWFPAVKLKGASKDATKKDASDTKLVYCWSNVLTVLDVRVTEAEEPAKPPNLEFNPRSRWRADEAIVATQWLGRSVLGVLTISQRLLIVEDGSLQVTDSIDLLHRHIFHEDLFSRQLHVIVEQLSSADPSMHGVVADAFYMSFRAYKGRTFLLGTNDLTVGTLSNWADRLMALMEKGDHIAAIRLATEYYAGGASNVTVGLPEDDIARHLMVRERLLSMVTASIAYDFAQQNDGRKARLHRLAEVSFDACVQMEETDYLFSNIFESFEEADEEDVFVTALEPYILDGEITTIPPDVVKCVVSHYISENQSGRLEELLCRLDPLTFDIEQITTLCRQHSLYDALIYVWTDAVGDFVTPLVDLLSLVQMLKVLENDELEGNPFYEAAMKIFPYLAFSLTGRRYPSGEPMSEGDADNARGDLYGYLFSGTPAAWPPGSKKVFRTHSNAQEEPAFPYLVLLLDFDAASFMSMLNEAFEDPAVNASDEEPMSNGTYQANGTGKGSNRKTTRQYIISILLDVMQQSSFSPEQAIYLDMFVARSLPKYPGQLVFSGSLLDNVLRRLCDAPVDELRDECQLSVEYLLSAYRPTDISVLIESLKAAEFFRVLKTVYRGEGMLTELLEAFFQDPHDKDEVFDSIGYCVRQSHGEELQAVKRTISEHIEDLAVINVIKLAQTLARYADDMLGSSLDKLLESSRQFIFLRTLLEPSMLHLDKNTSDFQMLPVEKQTGLADLYVKLMCKYDRSHVADYVSTMPTSNLQLDQVLPSMEESGVIDAAVILLTRDGLARDAMDRLVTHLYTLQQALASLVSSSTEQSDADEAQEAADELVEAIQKYTKVGIWLCQGQSATAQRRPRPRVNLAWDIDEDDLDLDEYLWLNLADTVVQVTKSVSSELRQLEEHPTSVKVPSLDVSAISRGLRTNVQTVFTTLMAVTVSSSDGKQDAKDGQAAQAGFAQDHQSFLRVLRAFISRAAATAPSLSDLRAVLADIFSAYAFEQEVLSIANGLLGSAVFSDIEGADKLRQRGWRPRTQTCEECKRRTWGPGIGGTVWEAWKEKEQQREAARARKLVERGGGVEARRLSRGKAKASNAFAPTEDEEGVADEHRRSLELVVFACRHVFHRVCLDEEFKNGKAPKREMYKCPLCMKSTQ